MAYQALYRTYRPTKFNEVVGQKHIIQILQNAVLEKKTSHAYVFSGLRGIGKTTIARIFAKAVNCENSYDGEPCGTCDNCKAVMSEATTDIVELDAASNNGVDQMREILEKVNFLPSALNKKVYIIDEAHMLSTAAFNALLKTLEEPPAHVIFILATTEPYKIPSTILSRCQRLDFKQLSTTEIVEMLINVSIKEKIKITDEALVAIAEASEGGMRDALSILDQARVYDFNQITLQNINDITGRVSFDYLVDLIRALNTKDPAEALSKAEALIDSGKEVSRILSNLIQFCRDLLLYKNLKEEISASYIYRKDVFSAVAGEITEAKLFYYVDMFVDIQNKIRFTNSPKLFLEVGIIKIINNASADLDVMSKIQKLEEKIDFIQPSSNNGTISEVSNRLDIMDNKIKKLANDIAKNNIEQFKDSITSKINLLEEMVLANKNIPSQIEEQIQELRNSVQVLESIPTVLPSETNVSVDNSLVDSKIQELENKINSINVNPFDSSSLEAKIQELESQIHNKQSSEFDYSQFEQVIEDVKNQIVTQNNSNYDQRISVLENQINSIQTNNTPIVETVHVDNSTQAQLYELKQEIQNLKSSSQPSNYVPQQSGDVDERINVVEEYLDMVISRVDELARNIKSNNAPVYSEGPSSGELAELNENYLSLISFVQELQAKVNDVPSESVDNELIENVKNEINEQFNLIIESIKIKVDSNYEELNNKINDNYQSSQSQFIEIESKLQKPEVNYESLIDENKQMIQEVKDYSIKLSSKVQEVQDRIKEVNTKLDGGYTKRRSPFEVVREEEKKESIEQPKEEVKPQEEVKAETPKEPVNKNVMKNDTTVVIRSEPRQEEPQKVDESSKVYDAKIVERILHQARDRKCREEKIQILNNWHKMEVKVGHLLAPTAKLLAEGTLTANGFNELLIVFPHASMCNHLMEPKGHTNAIQILKTTFGKDYDFIALPENTWQEKRLEYAGQYNMGIKYPKLTPIKNPELKIVVVNTTNLMSKKNQSIHKAQTFFGEDIVEREEE